MKAVLLERDQVTCVSCLYFNFKTNFFSSLLKNYASSAHFVSCPASGITESSFNISFDTITTHETLPLNLEY